ncbi:MAG TPA: hypothetical protein VF204_11040, partial [Streptosporangiaceae bacterium]
KNRLHLDVLTAGPLEDEVARLVEAGAALVEARQDPASSGKLRAERYTRRAASSRLISSDYFETLWSNAAAVYVQPSGTCTYGLPIDRVEFINGIRVVLEPYALRGRPGRSLCAAHATGLWIKIMELGPRPPIRVTRLFRQHVRLFGRNPGELDPEPHRLSQRGRSADEVELDPVHQRAVRDRARVGGALAQGLEVRLPGPADILRRDRGERHQVHRVDLDLRGPDPVPTALLNLRPLPEPERYGDVARQHRIPQLLAELHVSAGGSPAAGR